MRSVISFHSWMYSNAEALANFVELGDAEVFDVFFTLEAKLFFDFQLDRQARVCPSHLCGRRGSPASS